MANICQYKGRIRGKKKACYAAFSGISAYDEKCVADTSGTDDDFLLEFRGDCKWRLDTYCDKVWEGKIPVELSGYSIDELGNGSVVDFWYYGMNQLSKMMDVEIEVISWSGESSFQAYSHYRSGKVLTEEMRALNRRNASSGKLAYSLSLTLD